MLGSVLDHRIQTDAIQQFADVLADAGLLLKGLPVMDGRLHHVPTVGAKSKSDKAGVYVGHLDGGIPAGWFNNYRADPIGEGQKWKATGVTDARSSAEVQKAKHEAESRRAEAGKKRAEQEERIARWAERKWNRSEPATTHPYLERKGVAAHGLRIDAEKRLVIPMQDVDGKIWSLQTISADAEKRYTSGGRKKGLHALLGTYDPAKPLVFAEGFATAASIHQATGLAVAVAFDSGNVKPVAEAFRARSASQALIFAADNDHHLPLKKAPTGRELPNVGVEKAEQAALAVNGSVVVPTFERGDPGTDWNDYAAQHGLKAVHEAFRGWSQATIPVSEAPGIAKEKPVILNPNGPSNRPKQEVFMQEQQGAGVAETQTDETQVRASEGGQVQESDSQRIESADRKSARASTAAPAEPLADQPLKRFTRADVERALRSGASLVQKDLSGVDLSNLKFDGINLAGSNLSGTLNVNTTYEASRLDGVNFSDALFRGSTIERVFAVNSRWDRAQFDQTEIVFSNFGKASFRDTVFRDVPRTRDQEEPARKQPQPVGERSDNPNVAEESRKPGRSAWPDVAARAGLFLKDIGRGLKNVSGEVYHKLRDWWTQPLQLAPEIDRNAPLAWTAAPPAYGTYDQSQGSTWGAPQTERVQAQMYSHANVPGRAGEDRNSRSADTTKPLAGVRQGESQVLPALVARNNFQFADFTGARFESIRVQDNDFRHARLVNARFPDELRKENKTTLKEVVEVKVKREADDEPRASVPRARNKSERQSSQRSRQHETSHPLPVEQVAPLSWSYDGPTSARDLMATVEDLHRRGAEFLIHDNRYLSVAEISGSRDRFEEQLTKMDEARPTDSSHELVQSAQAAGWAAANLFGHLGLSRDESVALLPVDHSLADNPKLAGAFVAGFAARTQSTYSEQEELYLGSKESIAAQKEREEFLGRVSSSLNDRQPRDPAEPPGEAHKRNDEYYGRLGFSLDRGSSERAQAISEEAERLNDDLTATHNVQDRKDLINKTTDLQAEIVVLRVEGQATQGQARESEKEEMPSLAMDQARFDALLSVGVFDEGKSAAWRMSMEERVSTRFHDLAAQTGQMEKDHRGLWHDAAKQVQQGELLASKQPARETPQDRGLGMDDPNPLLAQKQEVRRALAHAR